MLIGYVEGELAVCSTEVAYGRSLSVDMEGYSCAIRGKENIEWVEVSEEETIDLDELEDMFPDDFCGV